MATASTPSPNHSLTSLLGTTGGGGTTTTDLATVGDGAPSTTTSLPIASGVTVNSPQVNPVPSQVAILTQSDTTLTAYAVPGTTGLAVLDGQTLSFRAEGITLSDGNVVSLGFNGLVESTATGTYQPLTDVSALLTSSEALPTGPGPVIFNSTISTTASGGAGLTSSQTSALATLTTSPSGSAGTSGGGASSGGSGGGSESTATQASASASSSPGAAASLSAGKAAMLLGAVGGVVAFGL